MPRRHKDGENDDAEVADEPKKGKNKANRKDKPWDTDDIDHWKIEPVTEDNKLDAPLEESSFATLFPKYREKYIREIWPIVTRTLNKHGIKCELNLTQGSMTVKTTRKTWDPFVIIKSRDLIKLLSRSIPVQQALKVLADEMYCDIIKIKNMVRNKERFAKRRQRLIGPNGSTLKAIELVTGCYVMVQGNTVSAMGNITGLKHVRIVVEECMKNVHPIYNIKKLMIKKQLMENPELKDENWDRFLPTFKKKNVKRKKVVIQKKEKALFPPEQTPRKVDLELESGEYFLNAREKQAKKKAKRAAENAQKKVEKAVERSKDFIAPPEASRKRKNPTTEAGSDVSEMAAKLKKASTKKNKKARAASEYLL